MNSGYYDEARAWRAWLLRAVAGSPAQLQIMYGLAGERRLAEWEIPWLPGYEGSKPVRIGNAAHEQLQLDVYGEVMDACYQARRGGLARGEAGLGWLQRASSSTWSRSGGSPTRASGRCAAGRASSPISKVMAWVAFDRAIRLVEMLRVRGPVDRWREVRDAIHEDVCENGYDADLGSFVQSYGSKQLDASLLLIPPVGFLPPEDKRVRGTVKAVERNLVEDGLVMRYHTGKSKDGLPPGEGAFLACSFWLADAYVMVGRHDDAAELFERLLALRNDVGLLSEEYDVQAGRQVGNFPQAFSHLALVNTAHNLTLRREAGQAARPRLSLSPPAPAGRRAGARPRRGSPRSARAGWRRARGSRPRRAPAARSRASSRWWRSAARR